MSFINEGRLSESPFVESIWRGQAGINCFPNCPAEGRWQLLLLRENDRVKVSVAGPMTAAKIETHHEGVEWLVIKFKLGTYLPVLPARKIVDGRVILPEAARKSFWLYGTSWQYPDYGNVETFVDQLVHDEVLARDPVVSAALQDRPLDMSPRTVRHHFLQVTGLPQGTIRQIEQAYQAVALLEQGVSILDTVHQVGYADQPHLTRSLKRLMGQTPAQIVALSKPL